MADDVEEEDFVSDGEDEGLAFDLDAPGDEEPIDIDPEAQKMRRVSPEQDDVGCDFDDFRCRPEVPVVLDRFKDLKVQIVDVEIQQRPRIEEFEDPDVMQYLMQVASEEEMGKTQNQWGKRERSRAYLPSFMVPCERIYGRLEDGKSVCVNVYGYFPVVHLLVTCQLNSSIVEEVRAKVETMLCDKEKSKKPFGWMPRPQFRYVLDAKIVKAFVATPYIPNPCSFVALKLASSSYVKPFGDYYYDNKVMKFSSIGEQRVIPYSCINTMEQFMADLRIAGFGWINLSPGKWKVRKDSKSFEEPSRCNYEIDCNVSCISPLKEDAIAPLRKITFDLEMSRKEGFPTADRDPIICISAVCGEYVNGAPIRKRKVLLQFRSSDPSDYINPEIGERQFHFKREDQMINAFGKLMYCFDPDFIGGHNIMNFDIPYLVQRANLLRCNEFVQFLGRRGSYRWLPPRKMIKKRKNGEAKEVVITDTPGLIQLDTLPWIKAIRKLRSYGLGYLSSYYLNGNTKMDVSYIMITPLWNGSDATRKRLGDYCMKDSMLDDDLIDHKEFNMVTSAVEMARQTRVPASKLLRSGQQARVWGVLLEKSKSPNWKPDTSLAALFPYERPSQRDKDDKFAGAEVLQPKRGFYKTPIVCGDFRSLYPSIIIDLNIDFATLLEHEIYKESVKYKTSPSNVDFVDKSVRMGLLPQVEEELMAARDEAKKCMSKETDPTKKKLYDSRQNEIKVICNSGYGILTASGGRLVRICLGLSVTSQGKKMIHAAKEVAEKEFACDVIYGDTDSIFIKVPESHAGSSEDAFKLLVNICDRVTSIFAPSPIMLQAEKLMEQLIMINKKRYIGSKRLASKVIRDKTTGAVTEVTLKPPELLTMGVEIARRDNCLMVKEGMEDIITELLLKRDVEASRAVLDNILKNLLAGKIDIGKLVISKAITRNDYKNEPIQVDVSKRMIARDPSYEGGIGDRIPYVIVNRPHRKLADQGEDPQWAIDHDMTIDVDYYIEHQLQSPMARIFMWLLINKSEKGIIEYHEAILRKLHEDGKDEEEDEYAEKILGKDLERIRKRVEILLCGPGARSAFTRKVVTGSSGIAKFFKPVQYCTRCKKAPQQFQGRCKECQPGMAPCKASGCKNKLQDVSESYCEECRPSIGTCSSCAREMPLVEDVCMSCMDGVCYSCGSTDAAVLRDGVCGRCFKYVQRKKANRVDCTELSIEDLGKMAEQAKQECFTRCGRVTDDIKCVSRDCATLYKRATIAARIRNYR